MPTTMPSRAQVTGEPVVDADQLPAHPDDEHGDPQDRNGYVAQERRAARHRRAKGQPPTDALAYAVHRKHHTSLFPVLTPADVASVAAAVKGHGVPGVQA